MKPLSLMSLYGRLPQTLFRIGAGLIRSNTTCISQASSRRSEAKAFTHGCAYYVDGYAAAALWLPPDVLPHEDMLSSIFQRSVSEQIQKDVITVFDPMGRYHPSEPHWHLPLMGVDPLEQGKGFGSALMQLGLIQCDRDNTFAYLESSSPRSVPF
jgi:GNAT superfamily N-acetyltransferase